MFLAQRNNICFWSKTAELHSGRVSKEDTRQHSNHLHRISKEDAISKVPKGKVASLACYPLQ